MKTRGPVRAGIKGLFRSGKSAPESGLAAAAGRYWGLSGWNDRVQDQAHWCGAMRWQRERWQAHGDFYFGYSRRLLHAFAGSAFVAALGEKTALEWGCGGGAHMRCLCGAFAQVYGVEISPDTWKACERQLTKLGLGNFIPVLFPAEEPEAVLRLAKAGSVDFILSVAVFQHFPSKAYTLEVLRVMEKLLRADGFALIQVRYFDGSEKYRQKESDYAQNVITMTSFTFDEFSGQLRQAGLKLLHSEKDIERENLCHEYYFVTK